VATVGRNLLLRHFLRERQGLLQKATAAAALLRKSMATTLQSLAWEVRLDLAQCPTESVAETKRFISERQAELSAEVRRRRDSARQAVELAQSPDMPLSEGDWVNFFVDNEERFRERMATASQTRRDLNRRLRPAPDTPAPAARLECLAAPPPKMNSLPMWKQLAWGRSGWHCAKLHPADVAALFLCQFQQRTLLVDISHVRSGIGYALDSKGLLTIVDRIVPLEGAE